MRKILLTLLVILLILSVIGCSVPQNISNNDLENVEEVSEQPTPEPTTIPTLEPTPEPTPEVQASEGTGEMKQVIYNDITFLYNDKNVLVEKTEENSITIRYEPQNTFANIFYSEKIFTDDESNGEVTFWHAACYSGFEMQNEQTNDIEIAGIMSKTTLAYIRVGDSPWLQYLLFTIPTGEGFVSFAFFMNLEDIPEEDYSGEFIEMVESIKIIDN